ncbi:MAG: ACP S-malonyltransferase [Parachlamydiaceae bacterium]
MSRYRKIAFLFPGQGAQYTGMAKDFFNTYPVARDTFVEADDILGRKLSSLVFEGPETTLTETKNSQLGIYVASNAILRAVTSLFPQIVPSACAGLSLGEYTALTASRRLAFSDGVSLVAHRGQYMNDACERTKGTMAVIVGLDAETASQVVKEVGMPHELWAANFNCPGQVVISGTLKGIEAGSAAAKAKGAKRVLPIQVHGAFHSGLMQLAEDQLAPFIEQVELKNGIGELVMNVTGNAVQDVAEIRRNLIKQVTHPVRWEQSIRFLIGEGVDLFVELGCGKVLAGFNKRIDPTVAFTSVEKIEDMAQLEHLLNER